MPLSLLRNVTFSSGRNDNGMLTSPVYNDLSSMEATTMANISNGYHHSVTMTLLNTSNTHFDSLDVTRGITERDQVITLSPKEALERALISWDDATWILTSAFIIFTMQSGFGLLEAGYVSAKNEVNIMVKNAVDVVFGGFAYWLFGYGLSFGQGKYANSFMGWGDFFVDADDENDIGLVFSNFIFQLSFATTATTIVSGAMAERTKLSAYVSFSFLNTIVYCIPAHWIWSSSGFLNKLGCVDIAGSGGVHLVGGVSALVATLMLKPRTGRFDKTYEAPPMGNPTNAMVGMFMLWWGWLGFNCGSTFGISYGKWKLAAKSSVITLTGSTGGGVLGFVFSYWWRKRVYSVGDLVTSILGSLVSITAGCAVIRPWEAIVIGAIGAVIVILGSDALNRLKIDDPVAAAPTHGLAGIWGLLAVGLFVEDEPVMNLNNGQVGLFKGGGAYSLGVQALAALAIAGWAAVTTVLLLLIIKYTIGLRLSRFQEAMGSDFVEHGIVRKCSCSDYTIEGHLDSYQPRMNGLYHRSPCVYRRSSFGFTRDVTDVVSPNGLQSEAPGANENHHNGHCGHENAAVELSTVEEDDGEDDNKDSITNYI